MLEDVGLLYSFFFSSLQSCHHFFFFYYYYCKLFIYVGLFQFLFFPAIFSVFSVEDGSVAASVAPIHLALSGMEAFKFALLEGFRLHGNGQRHVHPLILFNGRR